MLAETFDFDGNRLVKAVRATFNRRETAIDPDAVCLSDAFANSAAKAAQWNAFVRRSRLTSAPPEFPEVVKHIAKFLQPIARAAAAEPGFDKKWKAGGPWRAGA